MKKYYVDIIRIYPVFGTVRSKGWKGYTSRSDAKLAIFHLQGQGYDYLTGASYDFSRPYEVRLPELVEERSFRIMRRK